MLAGRLSFFSNVRQISTELSSAEMNLPSRRWRFGKSPFSLTRCAAWATQIGPEKIQEDGKPSLLSVSRPSAFIPFENKKAAGASAPAARKEPHDGYARIPSDDLTVWFNASVFAAEMNAR